MQPVKFELIKAISKEKKNILITLKKFIINYDEIILNDLNIINKSNDDNDNQKNDILTNETSDFKNENLCNENEIESSLYKDKYKNEIISCDLSSESTN